MSAKRKAVHDTVIRIPRLQRVPSDLLDLCVEFAVWDSFRGRTVSSFRFNVGPYAIATRLACHSNGTVFVGGQCHIHVFSSTGTLIKEWQLSCCREGDRNNHNGPNALCIVGNSMFVASCDSTVHVYDTNGTFRSKWSAGCCVGITVTRDKVYTTTTNGCIQGFTWDGLLIQKWGSHGSTLGQFMHPSGIVVTSKNEVWVADRENNRVQIFDSRGNFLDVAGDNMFIPRPWNMVLRGDNILVSAYNSILEFTPDGAQIAHIQFSDRFQGMAVDKDGRVLVSTLNNTVVVME